MLNKTAYSSPFSGCRADKSRVRVLHKAPTGSWVLWAMNPTQECQEGLSRGRAALIQLGQVQLLGEALREFVRLLTAIGNHSSDRTRHFCQRRGSAQPYGCLQEMLILAAVWTPAGCLVRFTCFMVASPCLAVPSRLLGLLAGCLARQCSDCH